MAQVVVRNIQDEVKAALKHRASQHGWSMEEETRQILQKAVGEQRHPLVRLGSRIAARFAGRGLTEPLPELHGQTIEPVAFGE